MNEVLSASAVPRASGLSSETSAVSAEKPEAKAVAHTMWTMAAGRSPVKTEVRAKTLAAAI